METKDSTLAIIISISLDSNVFLWTTGHNKNYYYYSFSGRNHVPYRRGKGEVKASRVFNDDVPLPFFLMNDLFK